MMLLESSFLEPGFPLERVELTLHLEMASLIRPVGSMSKLAFGSWQVLFLDPAHSFASDQLLVKG